MKKFTVDRTEENFAVCETEERDFVNIELSLLPGGVKDGSVLLWDGEKYELSTEEENLRRKKLFDLQNSLFDE